MRKTLVSLLVLCGLLVSATAFAIADTSTDYFNTVVSSGYCPVLTRTLTRGMRDANTNGEVTNLQMFLADYYQLSPSFPTGYFGAQTQKYVIQFQKEQGLPAYGIVGSMTRARIAQVCMNVSSSVPAEASSTPPGGDSDAHGCKASAGYSWDAASQSCRRPWEAATSSGDIHVNPPKESPDPAANPQCKAWFDGCNDCSRTTPGGQGMCTMKACVWANQKARYCKEYFSTSSASSTGTLSITSFTGPATLKAGQQGTWTLTIADTASSTHGYFVHWNDTNNSSGMLSEYAQDTVLFTSNTATMSHTYVYPGTYTIDVTARNASSNAAYASARVTVTGDAPNASSSASGGYACTMEAKQCPDGSYVSRSGPNCAFAACPTATENSTPGTMPSAGGSSCQSGGKYFGEGTTRDACALSVDRGGSTSCYMSGTVILPTYKCTAGQWRRCNTDWQCNSVTNDVYSPSGL